jgi:hypothetical protein
VAARTFYDLFEIARVLVRPDHGASVIVNADNRRVRARVELRVTDGGSGGIQIPQADRMAALPKAAGFKGTVRLLLVIIRGSAESV